MTSFVYNGVNYTLPNAAQEEIGQTFGGFARGAFKGAGRVCVYRGADAPV
jgi:hypothetical protein